MTHVKLHIPGPVEVGEKTLRAFASPMIGHRGQGFKDLYAKIQPQLQSLLYTRQLVYLSTSSAWGVMEGAIRNLVTKGPQLHVTRRVLGQVARRLHALRQAGRGAQGRMGFAHPRRTDRRQARDRPVRRAHAHPQRNVHRRHLRPLAEIAALREEISRRHVHC